VDQLNSIIVKAGEVCVSRNSESLQPPISTDAQKYTLWRDGTLRFEHTLFKNLLTRIENFYDIHITAKLSEELLQKRITATFISRNPQEILNQMSLLMNVSWRSEDEKIIIMKEDLAKDTFFKLFQKPTNIFSFQNPEVSLFLNNESLMNGLLKLRENPSFNINFVDDMVNRKSSISLNVDHQPLSLVLMELLQGTEMSYYIHDPNTILLINRELGDHITGKVRGLILSQKTQRPQQGVSVFLENSNYKCVSDENGNYQLPSLFAGKYVLVVEQEGLPPIKHPVEVQTGSTEFIDIYYQVSR